MATLSVLRRTRGRGGRVVGTVLVVLSQALLTTPAAIAAAPTGVWTGDFAIPAFDGDVYACAILDGSYFVGGEFQWAGEVPTRNVAMWTGSEWAQVGLGLPSRVRKLAVWGTELLAATDDYLSSNAPLMRFDGVSWKPVGTGVYGEVDAILVDGPNVYVGGQLYQVGSTNGYRVMRWDGFEWQGVGGAFDNRVRALAMYQGQLYVGGEFLSVGSASASRIARWNGTQWEEVAGGTGAGGSVYVGALETYQGRLIAGGWFPSMGNVSTNGIAAWDGSTWQALPETPVDVVIQDLQTEGNLLHVAGVLQMPAEWAAGLVTFDGATWRPPSTYPSWGISDVAIGDGALIAVGFHSELVETQSRVIPTRDVVVRDPAWRPLTPWRPTMRGLLGPSWTMVSALHNYGGELFAGGYFQYAADPPGWTEVVGLARWDGAWRAVPGMPWGWVNEITSWGDRLIIAGPTTTSGTQSSVNGWDGTTWSDLGGPIHGWVGALSEWNGALAAGGDLLFPGTLDHFSVAINRGSGWEKLGALELGGQWSINDLASFGGDLFAAGYFGIPGVGWRGLARWDGSNWVEVPRTPVNTATCLLTRQDGLWVGAMANPRGPIGDAVWKWDGQRWTSIGELFGSITRLIEVDGTVMASGALNLPGGPTTLAAWDGVHWVAIPDAPDRRVEAMASVGRDLWVGGSFTRAGGGQAEAVARWRRDPVAVAQPLAMLQPWPTPARDQVSFRFTLPSDGQVEVRIYDLRGALVARPIHERLPAGTHERTWSIGAGSGTVRPGVYFARLVTPSQSIGARIVIAR